MANTSLRMVIGGSLLLLFFFTQSSCKKRQIKKFPEKIIGVWNWTGDCQDLFYPCVSRNEVYLNNSKWFVIKSCSLCFKDKECNLCDIPCLSQSAYISDTLSYWIEKDLLIRERHDTIFDSGSKLVTDTFVIVKIGAMLDPETHMFLEPINQKAAHSFGISIGKKTSLEKYSYKKSFKSCVY
jgi:hypothetical protein